MGDLSPNQEKFVPVMHILGIDRYIGTIYVPVSMQWENPVTGRIETTPVSKMLSIDQWQAEDLTYLSQA